MWNRQAPTVISCESNIRGVKQAHAPNGAARGRAGSAILDRLIMGNLSGSGSDEPLPDEAAGPKAVYNDKTPVTAAKKA
jgi:hypothetical protein